MVLGLKLALRRLLKAPAFAAAALLMLALGVAMSTLSFTTTNGVLLRPLPFHDPGQLVAVSTVSPQFSLPMLTPASALAIREQLREVGDFGLVIRQNRNVAEPGQPAQQRFGMAVSANVLALLGVQPVLGRGFLPGEDAPNQPPVMLLTDRFWRQHFGADPGVLGKVLRVQAANFTVIGVLPPIFDEVLLWSGCDYVTLMTVWPNWSGDYGGKWMGLMGRLMSGVSLGRAQVQLDALARQLGQQHPAEMASDSFRLEPLGPSVVTPQIRMIYWLVVALSVFVLVIACANLAAVQLARAFGRQGELAIRAALGATRRDLLVALAAECVLLAIAGTALGLMLTYGTSALFSRWVVGSALPMDARVVAFGVAAGLLSALCFGLAPGWLMSRNLAQTLKEEGRTSTASRGQNRLKHVLIAGQLGLALVLVSTAASLVLGVRAFSQRERGWRAEGLVSTAFQVPWDWVQKEQQEPRLARLLEKKLGAVPGVERVAVTTGVLLYGDQSLESLFIDGREAAVAGREPKTYLGEVNASFFATLGVTLREGRLWTAEWRRSNPPVAVVSATTAKRFWPGGSALGQRIRLGKETAWRQIIGVVSDASYAIDYETPPTDLQVYRPCEENASAWYGVILQTQQPALALEKSIRAVFADIDPDIMVVKVAGVRRSWRAWPRPVR